MQQKQQLQFKTTIATTTKYKTIATKTFITTTKTIDKTKIVRKRKQLQKQAKLVVRFLIKLLQLLIFTTMR